MYNCLNCGIKIESSAEMVCKLTMLRKKKMKISSCVVCKVMKTNMWPWKFSASHFSVLQLKLMSGMLRTQAVLGLVGICTLYLGDGDGNGRGARLLSWIPGCLLEGRWQPVHSRARLQNGPAPRAAAAHGFLVLSPRGLFRAPGSERWAACWSEPGVTLASLTSVYRSGPGPRASLEQESWNNWSPLPSRGSWLQSPGHCLGPFVTPDTLSLGFLLLTTGKHKNLLLGVGWRDRLLRVLGEFPYLSPHATPDSCQGHWRQAGGPGDSRAKRPLGFTAVLPAKLQLVSRSGLAFPLPVSLCSAFAGCRVWRLSALHKLNQFSHSTTMPISEVRRPRYRKGEWFDQGSMVSKW